MEARVRDFKILCSDFDDGGGGPKSRNAGSFQRLESGGKPSPLQPPERRQPCRHLNLIPLRPVPWTSDVQNCTTINLLFQATKFVVLCYSSSNRKLIQVVFTREEVRGKTGLYSPGACVLGD